MKEQLETLKKWVATGQVKTARGRQHDDLLTLIGQMEVALRQPHVSGSVCTCLNAQTEKYSQVPVYCHNCKAYVQTAR